jgi:16S rRNA (cytosine967-C5)-methyltransferase
MPKPPSSNSRNIRPTVQNSAQKSNAPQGSAQPQQPSHAPITPARSAAFAILLRVADTSAHSDDLLHGPGMSALSQADRNLAHTLVLGVLRWQIALDARMQPLLQRPDQALPTPVATALRMGAFQLLHLDRIPAHAALSESVELVRAAGHPHAAGMVNAILRKLTRQPPARPKLYETTTAFAERLAHPLWLANRWVQNYGRTAALAILTHDQTEPQPNTLFISTEESTFPHLAASSSEAAAFRLPATIGYSEPSGSGLIASQNEAEALASDLPHLDDGSRLVAELAAASHPTPTRIWDTCAAPGGKTLILAARHPSAHLLATDANPRRLQALTTRLEATAPQTRTLHADATQLPETEGLFDLILCDVPCSGTGTLSRNPEIRQRLQPSDLARQATRQREILTAALARLASGGHLLYSTCSLEPEENEQVVAAALAATPGITTLPLDPILTHLATTGLLTAGAPADLLRNGNLRTLPGANFSGDGFFAALLHRP